MSSPIRPEQPSELIAKSRAISEIVARLDSWGFDIGTTRISVWTALLVVLIIIGVIVAARAGSGLARRLF